ncbi:MAG: hypothetical protein AAFN43_10905, partial [Pseudomonadota bacterium]
MKNVAGQGNHGSMVAFNTWFFGVSALLIGVGYLTRVLVEGGMFPDLQGTRFFDLTLFASFSLMFCGLIHSTFVLKPDLRRRINEQKLIALKANASRHEDFTDKTTGLNNRSFFLSLTDEYITSQEGSSRGVGVIVVHVACPTEMHVETLRLVAACLLGKVRDYDIVARVGFDEIAITAPNVVRSDLVNIASRFENAILRSEQLPLMTDFTLGLAVSNDALSDARLVFEAAKKHLS